MRAGGSRVGLLLARTSAYPRTETHLSRQTLSGAALTVSAVLLVLCLVAAELREFLNVESSKRLGVDTARAQSELDVELDIAFPSLPCAVLHLDALDLAGAHEWDAGTGLKKTRLNAEGRVIGAYEAPSGVNDLFSIFGAANAQLLRLSGLLQLAGPEAQRETQEALAAHEGCVVRGKLPVPRVAGSFQLSVTAQSFFMTHQMQAGAPPLNISHHIRKLSFGPAFPGAINPLDGFVRTTTDAAREGTWKYYLKLVPTQFRRLDGHLFNTHQYSVTEYFTVSREDDGVLPAVLFSYDFSPITLTIEERRRPLLHVLTRICAVVGGVFAMFGMFSKLV